jgi:low temperature requirement protein LtrA
VTSPSGPQPAAEADPPPSAPESAPQRVSPLELFFDLVFVFTITQLTSTLARSVTAAAAGRLLLIFGVLWWMYGGYAWLTNARTPARTPERLLLLVGMAGFLVIGLSVPHAFGRSGRPGQDGLALGLGYLVVVLVHSLLYLRVNRNIWRILPFNLTSAVLVIVAGITAAPAAYALWAAALVIQVIGPALGRLDHRFDIRPAHFVERHGALMIVAIGESVADVGIGAEGHPVTVSLALSAALGLALSAALWWAFFGTGDDDRAEEALTGTGPDRRPGLVLSAYGYAYIPMLAGIAATAAGLRYAIGHPGATLTAGPAIALAGGVTLFLAGNVWFRCLLGLGPLGYRALAAVLALAAWPLSVAVDAAAGIAFLVAVTAGAVAAESQAARSPGRATVEA